jgi:signal transduction histidine kinase
MLFVLFITAVFVVVAALVMAKAITDPIRSLQKGAEIIGNGNLDHKVALQSKDEIGQLSRAIDEMVARIKRVTASRDLLDKVTKELARSNAELEQFAYVASHDPKSPLRAIESLASWIREDLEPVLTDATRKHLDLLGNRVLRMEKLLDDLLDYSRIGRAGFDIKETDTAELVRQITGLLHVPGSFTVETRGTLPVFHTAATPFGTVVRNLINNAIKHHDKNGGLIVFTAEDRGPLYEFCLSDDGPGIPAEFRERVFGMFQTLKSRDEVEGSGIGLTIVKKAVEYFGGTVTLEDNVPRGLRVRFTWPKTIEERKMDDA